VIKIEPPEGGDPFRGFDGSGCSPQFCAYNHNKRSLALDISLPDGRAILLDLLGSADVLLDNMRPGVLARLGLDAPVLAAANPALIHASLTGFGTEGPYRDLPAYDTVAMAMGGLLSQLLDGQAPRIAGPAMADAVSGLYTAIGILGALLGRARGGTTRRVEVAMNEAVSAFACEPFASFFATGVSPGPYDRAAMSQSYAVRCADGALIGLHLSSPLKFWAALLAAIEAPELAVDPRFATRPDRVRNHGVLSDELAARFARRPRADWQQRLSAHEVPHAPILGIDEATRHQQALAAGSFTSIPHPTLGRIGSVATPIRLDGQRATQAAASPGLGADTGALLAELGLAQGRIDTLLALNVIATQTTITEKGASQ
jgi:formyl-CoA transferase